MRPPPPTLVTPLEPASAQSRQPAAAESGRWPRLSAFASLAVASASVCGSGHALNEDAHSEPGASKRLFVVADGVGGGALPGVVSRLVVSRLHERLARCALDADTLCEALLETDQWISGELEQRTHEQGAATVAVCARTSVTGSRWLIAWVGDCRIYRIGTTRGTDAELLTRDDTYRELQETPPSRGSSDDPARMIGNGAVVQPNVREVRLAHGEMLVLCSDGLHKQLSAREIGEGLRAGGLTLTQQCVDLARRAHDRGSDDATLLVLQRRSLPAMLAATCLGAAFLAMAALWLHSIGTHS